MSKMREEWDRLREIREEEREEAERVKMPAVRYRDNSMSEEKKRITDFMIRGRDNG